MASLFERRSSEKVVPLPTWVRIASTSASVASAFNCRSRIVYPSCPVNVRKVSSEQMKISTPGSLWNGQSDSTPETVSVCVPVPKSAVTVLPVWRVVPLP